MVITGGLSVSFSLFLFLALCVSPFHHIMSSLLLMFSHSFPLGFLLVCILFGSLILVSLLVLSLTIVSPSLYLCMVKVIVCAL